MFAKIAKATTLAALIAVGATAATTSQASAGNIEFGIQFGTPGYGYYYGSNPRWGAPPPRYRKGKCKPRRAVNKAWRMGVNNPRVVRRNPNRVVVRGWRHGYKTKVVFANARHCPVIRFR